MGQAPDAMIDSTDTARLPSSRRDHEESARERDVAQRLWPSAL
jgi:hypothetical protein